MPPPTLPNDAIAAAVFVLSRRSTSNSGQWGKFSTSIEIAPNANESEMGLCLAE